MAGAGQVYLALPAEFWRLRDLNPGVGLCFRPQPMYLSGLQSLSRGDFEGMRRKLIDMSRRHWARPAIGTEAWLG